MQLLRFKVGSDVFALPVERVAQIVEQRPVTRVPNVTDSIAGVFNHEGAITPLVDLATKFRVGHDSDARGCIVIVSADHDGDEVSVGLRADGVLDVLGVSSENIEPVPAFGTRIRLDYLAGLTKVGDAFTLILDADRFLTAEELLDLAAARAIAV